MAGTMTTPNDWEVILHQIFSAQRELANRFRHVEHLPAPPAAIQKPGGQEIIRTFAWRTTEEVVEAYQEYVQGAAQSQTLEELADGLHFFVELMIYSGITAETILAFDDTYPVRLPTRDTFYSMCWQAVYELGLAVHELKSKPWAQHPKPTNEERFRLNLLVAFRTYLGLFVALDVDERGVFELYFKKNAVNHQRIDREY